MIYSKIELYRGSIFRLRMQPIDRDRNPIDLENKTFEMVFFNTDTNEILNFKDKENFKIKDNTITFIIENTNDIKTGNVEFQLFAVLKEKYELIEKGTIIVKESLLTKK